MDLYFDNIGKLDEHFNDEDILDSLEEEVESGGKHDCTDYFGYYKDSNGDYWAIGYTCSYNDGFQGAYVTGPFTRTEEVVTVVKSIYKPKT